jgi:PEGA domain/Tetratricopeptide repeat
MHLATGMGTSLLKFLLASLMGAALLCGAARADNASDLEIARAHFQTGLSYYDSDRFSSAVKEFLESYRLSKRPELLYNIARSYERMGDPGHAIVYYRKFVQQRPSAKERHEIEITLPNLQRRAATLNLRTTVPGSEVLIDGELVGISPVDPQLLTEGKHHVEVRHLGYVAREAEVSLKGGQVSDLRIDPEPAGGAAPEPGTKSPDNETTLTPSLFQDGGGDGKGTAVAPPKGTSLASPPGARDEPRRGWVAPVLGVGAAVVVAVVVVVLVATLGGTDYSARARSMCGDPSCVLVDK